MVGVVVRGGPSETARAARGFRRMSALAPFAARYRLVRLRARDAAQLGLDLMPAGPADVAPVVAGRLAQGPAPSPRPGARLLASLRTVARLPYTDPETPVVVLVADHILDADLRPVLARHGSAGADLGLLCVPADERAVRRLPARRRSRAVACACWPTTMGSSAPCATLAWTGDLVVRAGSLARLLATLERALRGRRRRPRRRARAGAPRRRRTISWRRRRASGARTGTSRPASRPTTGRTWSCAPTRPRLDLYDPGLAGRRRQRRPATRQGGRPASRRMPARRSTPCSATAPSSAAAR